MVLRLFTPSCYSLKLSALISALWLFSVSNAIAGGVFEDRGAGADEKSWFKSMYQISEKINGTWQKVDNISPIALGEERWIEIQLTQPIVDPKMSLMDTGQHQVKLEVINSKDVFDNSSKVLTVLTGSNIQFASRNHSAVFTLLVTSISPGEGKLNLSVMIDNKNYGGSTIGVPVMDRGHWKILFTKFVNEDWKYILGALAGLVALISKHMDWLANIWEKGKNYLLYFFRRKKQAKTVAS